MGKILVIKGADFSAVAVGTVTPVGPTGTPVITISASGSVTIACTGATNIYYTTNGSTPTTASTKYTSAFTVSSGTTVKAIAEFSGGTTSSVVSKTYSSGGGGGSTYTLTWKQGFYGQADGKFTDASSAPELALNYISTEIIAVQGTSLKMSIASGYMYRVFHYDGSGKWTSTEDWSANGETKTYSVSSGTKFAISVKKAAGGTLTPSESSSVNCQAGY